MIGVNFYSYRMDLILLNKEFDVENKHITRKSERDFQVIE